MKRFFIAFLTSFTVIFCTNAAQDYTSIINTLGCIDGYEAYLNTGTFSPPPSNQRSAGYLSNYHDGYFRAVAEYSAAYDLGFAMGEYHHSQGWAKKAAPLFDGSSLPDGATVAVMKGLKVGYDDGYAKPIDTSTSSTDLSSLTDLLTNCTSNTTTDTTTDTSGGTSTGSSTSSSSTTDTTTNDVSGITDTSAQTETQQNIALYNAISKNQKLQDVLSKMQNVQHNDRCAEGVMSILSALLGEDIRKYNDWSQLKTNSGYPLIFEDDIIHMLINCGVFKQVDPNSPPKAFRVNDIQYTGGYGGHNEMLGPDGNWYSDGREYDGSVQYNSAPKVVQSYDLDIPAYLNYIKGHPNPNPNYVQPFPAFFDTDPNAAPYNDMLSYYYSGGS